ncbi:MAG: BadF/BadG/BcrA/BcrD ATPase family protein [Vicinamibacterales bacterium]
MAGSGANPTGSLGIDIGSLYLKSVEVDASGDMVWRWKERHRGNLESFVEDCRRRAESRGLSVAAVARGLVPPGVAACDPVVALAAGVRAACPEARNILEVGGSSLTLVHLDGSGQVMSVHRNSLCAAGTGSFLDEQAARLRIDRDATGEPIQDPPGIATRCAVFAKSDLVHRQQEGWSPQAVWSGLCRGLADGVLRTLTYGRPLEGLTVLCGGVSLDPSFVWWFERCLLERNGNGHKPVLRVIADPEFALARGAALLAVRTAARAGTAAPAAAESAAAAGRCQRPPLALLRSRYPESTAAESFVDAEGNEVTLHHAAGVRGPLRTIVGFDIGSTSTKCALIDADGRLLLDVYRKTEGDPISATRKLLGAVTAASERFGLQLDVFGAATTGSGRKLIGKVFGADLVVNEISAHAAGAVHLEPRVETVFEIGGQDAKYIAIRGGRVVDANMNYVCAAGTGSFVEELASKIGCRVSEVGDLVAGARPPYTSSRCTVFMEQDVFAMLRRGSSREEALGAVLYSVVENYLDRVVGRRAVSRDRVFFQGATARNKGLVAAIENLLGVEVVVSPSCHVMGAYGAALLALEGVQAGGARTRFRGFDLGSREIVLTHETCEMCVNRCRLTRAEIEGEHDRPAWGMSCGRDEQDTKVRVPREYGLMRRRIRVATKPEPAAPQPSEPAASPQPTARIGLPVALSTLSFMTFWTAFFRGIGMDVVLSGPTDQACIERSREHAAPELCLPLKVVHGHVAELVRDDRVDAVFLPHMVSDHPVPGTSGTKFCPYVETAPSVVRRSLRNGAWTAKPIVAPVIDLTLPVKWNAARLVESLAPLVHIDLRAAERAFESATEARARERDKLLAWGSEAIARVAQTGRPAVVLIGRPYNTLDPGISLDVPYHVADCGFEVIPMDCLPFDPGHLGGEFKGMFWHYGQRILSAVTDVAKTEGLYGIYLTSFGCGPDSFLLSYAEAIMGSKPFLVLELDEHGSNGGYQTRIEAFLDVIRSDVEARRREGRAVEPGKPPSASLQLDRPTPDLAGRTLWIPPMHSPGHRMFAAAFRSRRIPAQALPPEDDEAYAVGRRVTRGAECLPCPLTLGGFLKHMESERQAGRDPQATAALFMPTTCGPCRFGQYRTLARLAFDREGLTSVPILSPTQEFRSFDSDKVLRDRVWRTILAADILFKMRCKVRPRERTAGDALTVFERWGAEFERAIESGDIDWKGMLRAASDEFGRIPIRPDPVPLVGIVGEIYLRSNRYANGGLIEAIERMGGEAWLTPIGEWVEYCTWIERFRLRQEGAGLLERLKVSATWHYMLAQAHKMYASAPLVHDRHEPSLDAVMEAGSRYLPPEFQGESILALGRATLFAEQGADLVVNCSPFGCMQGNITTAIFERLGDTLPVPVVNLFYDGSEDNEALATFVQQAAERREARR